MPTPVVARGLIFLSSAHGRQRPLCAVRVGATGDITPTEDDALGDHIAWYKRRDGIYMQTPIVYGKYLYACKNNGVLSCYAAGTGERLYQERLGGGGFTASPVAADGRLYFTSEDGHVYVVRAGPTFELLATNVMDEVCMATPAISQRMLIVRTKNHVYGIGDVKQRGIMLAEVAPAPNSTVGRRGKACASRLLWRLRTVMRWLRPR